METSLSALSYKGSIPEAILESKKQKKLFVVYISGQNSDSVEMEKSTWNDSKVADAISKYCTLLHIREGSTDAANFSAIYPQKNVPSVTAVGYNGLQLWQSEGIVSAEVLASSLEKAWLGLHMQETTATVLTAALSSKKFEQSTGTGPSDSGLSQQGSSSGVVVPAGLADEQIQSSDAKIPSASEIGDDEHVQDDGTSTSKSLVDISSSDMAEQSVPPTKEVHAPNSPLVRDPEESLAEGGSSSMMQDRDLAQEKISDKNLAFSEQDSLLVTSERDEAVLGKRDANIDGSRSDTVGEDKPMKPTTDVHLNIRLPNGVNLQEKFPLKSTLRMVKDYVDSNQTSEVGSYDLAIPYPRKVFSNEDLGKSLSELGLNNRQALIVVPRQRASSDSRGNASLDCTSSYSDSSAVNSGGYFASLRRTLSYLNPLSYISGNASSSTSGQNQSGIWEYGPNSVPRNNLSSSERPYSTNSPNQSSLSPGRNSNQNRQSASRFGSNIHTLKHDEDDRQFGDRNAFWNGNSTQYGGNNDSK